VDAVRAADLHRLPVLEGAPLEDREEGVEVRVDEVGGVPHLQRQAGVEDVGAGEPLVDVTGVVAHVLGNAGEQGDHVVVELRLQLRHPRHVEARALADPLHRLLREGAEFGLRRAGGDLHL